MISLLSAVRLLVHARDRSTLHTNSRRLAAWAQRALSFSRLLSPLCAARCLLQAPWYRLEQHTAELPGLPLGAAILPHGCRPSFARTFRLRRSHASPKRGNRQCPGRLRLLTPFGLVPPRRLRGSLIRDVASLSMTSSLHSLNARTRMLWSPRPPGRSVRGSLVDPLVSLALRF